MEQINLTNTLAGLTAIQRCMAGEDILFTRLEIGDGILTNTDVSGMTGLINKTSEFPLGAIQTEDNEVIRLRSNISNKDISEDLVIREYGIYAKFGNEQEFLFAYLNVGESTTPLPNERIGRYELNRDFVLYIGNSTHVDFTSNGNLVYVAVNEYKDDMTRKANVVGTIEDLKNSKKYKIGDVVQVLGYYSAGDGAGHPRQKKPEGYTGSDAVIGVDGSIWGIVHAGEINVSWFGAKPFVGTIDDPQFDNKEIIQKALNYSAYKAAVVFSDLYNVDSTVIINSGNSIRGNVVSTGIRKGYHDDVKIGMYMQNTNGYILDSAIKKVATGELMFNACMDSSTVWDTGEYEGKVDVSIKDIGFYSNKWRSCFGGFNANGIVNLTIDNVKCLDMIVGVNVSGGWLARVEQLLSYCRYIGYNAYSMTSIETNNCYSTTVANKRLDYSNLGVYADNIPLHLKGTDILSQKNFAFISYDCGNLMTNCIAEGYTNGIGVYNDGFLSTVVEDTYVENVVNYMNYKGKGYFKTSIKNSAFVTNLFNIENTFTGTGENLFEVEYKSGTPKGQLGYTKAFDTITGATSPFIIGKGLDTAFLGNGASFVISNISARDGLVSTQKITTRPFETLDIGSGFYKHTTDLFRFNKTTINNITIPILECAVARATNNGIGNFRLYINPVNNTPTIQYYNSSGVLSSYELAQKTTVQILDTPYMTTKMQSEGVYEDFVVYMDSKLQYDNQQRELETQRQQAFEESGMDNYEEWLATQPMMLPSDSEPVPSAKLMEFKNKYLG